MKGLGLLFGFLFVAEALVADEANIYCRFHGQKVSALTETGKFDCYESFYLGEGLCFTGSSDEVTEIMLNNESQFNWNEGWVENVQALSVDVISYEFVDGPNDQRYESTILRCEK